MKIVFDVDDTLWSLNDRVCDQLGIDKSLMDSFVIRENTNLTEKEQDLVLAEYGKASNFENMQWFDGIDGIFKLIEDGHEVCINSNSCSHAIADLKKAQLKSYFGLPDENIRMNIMSHKTCTKKKMDLDVDIFIDDSPFNIQKSQATINFAIQCPWNSNTKAYKMIESKNVVFCEDFNDVMRQIHQYIEAVNNKKVI